MSSVFKGRRRFARRGGFRRASRYEMQRIRICRFGMDLGFSSCGVPDLFLTFLTSGSSQYSTEDVVPGTPPTVAFRVPEVARGVTVKGIRFSYSYAYAPETNPDLPTSAFGVGTIASALIVLPLVDGTVNVPEAVQASYLNLPEAQDAFGGGTQSRYRILWRKVEHIPLWVPGNDFGGGVFNNALHAVPHNVTQSSEVRLKTAVTLDPNHGLFWLSEVVNPFLEAAPTIALDMLGVMGVKATSRRVGYK